PQNFKTDTVKAIGDTSINQLRIKLSTSFGQSLLAKDTIITDSAFKVLSPGFALVPALTGNALSYFGLADANTKLAIYYKYKRSGLSDTSAINYFKLNIISATANNIVRDHTGSEVAKYNIPVHPAAGDDFIYIQTTPGTYAEIKIPKLDTLSNRIIHRAELIMDQIPPLSTDPFTPPNLLYLDLKEKDSSYRPIPCDYEVINGQPNIFNFGGYKTTVKDPISGKDIARYSFNLSRYVQKIVTNKRINSTLRLRAPDYVRTLVGIIDDCNQGIPPLYYPYNELGVGRVKLGGGANATYKMRLRIIYSNL
ncbi:MAG: DUF4270 domain-containing protein, partial [Bacteroidota bacterium]|nr:DUF4270 domain-containing protein [Bacteroidota bacterium]